MKYEKPELIVLEAAVKVIHGCNKLIQRVDCGGGRGTTNAYEADE
jgi:hypothetical protein